MFSRLAGPSGRAGVIVPTGIATDGTTAPFFASLIDGRSLAGLVDFENRDAIFPAVHRSYKFSLLSIGRNVAETRFSFFLTDPVQLAEPERRFALSPEQIAAINPNTKTAPVFRSRADAALTAKIYGRVPVLIEESKGRDGNSWRFSYATKLFDMADDSGLFRKAAQLHAAGFDRDGVDWVMDGQTPRQHASNRVAGRDAVTLDLHGGLSGSAERYVPLYEAKMIHQFNHRWTTYDASGDASRDVTLGERADPRFEPTPRYWVPEAEVADRLASHSWNGGWLMGWRDICRATDERTVIAAAVPRAGVGHTLRLMWVDQTPQHAGAFLSLSATLVLDFVAKQKVGGTHLTVEMWRQLPVLPPEALNTADLAFITPRFLELAYTSYTLTPLAADFGYKGPPFAWNEDRRALLRAELDAFYARAYGLTRDELRSSSTRPTCSAPTTLPKPSAC